MRFGCSLYDSTARVDASRISSSVNAGPGSFRTVFTTCCWVPMLFATISQRAGLSWFSTIFTRVLSQTDVANSRETSSRSASDWCAIVNWTRASRSWFSESTMVRSANLANSSMMTLNGTCLRAAG